MRRVSMKDVARHAGTSPATVSKVLNDGVESDRISKDCRRRVLAACRKLGYVRHRAARSLRTGRSFAIGGLLAMQVLDPGDARSQETLQFHAPLQAGMLSAASRCGLHLVAIPGGGSRSPAERALEQLREGCIDGLVVAGFNWPPAEPVVRRVWPQWPVVVAGGPPSLDVPNVRVDDLAPVGDAMEHLYALAHRAIAWTGPSEGPGSYPAERRRTYREWMQARGLRPQDLRAKPGPGADREPISTRIQHLVPQLAQALRGASPAPTGVLAYNDAWALAVYRACAWLGLRVPDDLSVIGFDDVYAAAAMPPLTTVSLELYRVGERAVERLVRMAAGEPEDSRTDCVPARLVLRNSTAPAAGTKRREART